MKKLITMLSALTITSSIVPLTVACGEEKELKGEAINIDSITAEMISAEVTSEQLAKGDELASAIEGNLHELFFKKLTGFDIQKLKKYDSADGNLTDTEGKNAVIFFMLSDLKAFSINVVSGEVVKNFTVSINIKTWDEIKDQIEKEIKPDKNKPTFYGSEGTKFEKLYAKVVPTLTIDSIKAMYDLIKFTVKTKTIPVDLSSKK